MTNVSEMLYIRCDTTLLITMKTLLITIVNILISITCLAQIDSNKTESKKYKNNFQTSVLALGGYFSLQYERAFNKDFSVSIIGDYKFPFNQVLSNEEMYKETYSIHAQLRYYLDKNSIPNNGLYVSGEVGYKYTLQYQAHHKSDGIAQKKYPWIGVNIGYQMLIKKRLVVDAGIGFQYGLLGEMYYPDYNQGWHKMITRENYMPIILNIGYAF